MGTVRAKVRIEEKTQRAWGDDQHAVDVTMNVVYRNSEENERFFKATPSGKITLGGLKPETAALFEIGKEYYVDFTPAAK